MNQNTEEILKKTEAIHIIGEGDIVIRMKSTYHESNILELEKKLSEKLERKVILLDARYGEILVVPPEKRPVGASREP